MKAFLIVFLCCAFTAATTAQEITGLRGEPILPEKGDWGITFDAVPFLMYAGNVLNHSANNNTQPEFPNGYENTLVLKNYKSDTRAIRVKLRLGFSTQKFDSLVVGLGDTVAIARVTDSKKISEKNIALGIGFQKSGGKGRLRAYRGMEFLIKFSARTTTYTYGDANLNSLIWSHTNTFGQGAGVKEVKEGNKFGLNLRYIIGAEYFFAPKMSLSAEYSWGIDYFVIGESTKTSEQWDFSSNRVRTTTKHIPSQPSFELDNFYDAASINLTLYF